LTHVCSLLEACAKRPHTKFLDYADSAEAAFLDAGGHWAKWASVFRKIVNVFLIFTQIGSNAIYVLFIAQNLQPVSDVSDPEVEFNL
jgi:hypothetical protein